MSREADFATRMTGDATLMLILLGGVYKYESVGIEGITRASATGAFDANGYLKPCALVKQRGLIPDGQIVDGISQKTSSTQVVEVWLYQDQLYTSIDSAMSRLYTLFQGYQLSDTFPIEWANTIDRQRDDGALKGKSLARMDFIVRSIRS